MTPPAPLAGIPPNTFVLLGPTAVGKTELAVALAEAINGEIVGADAFQLYAGLDLLSAKPTEEQRARVRHHLIGEIPLSTAFDVAQYRQRALLILQEIAGRGRTPILCGGAGMYVRALTRGLADTPPADASLRAQLEKEPLPALVARLRDLDPESSVDEKNPRRVIRALEVCLLSGRPFSTFRDDWDHAPIGRGAILTRGRDTLHARIADRVDAMFASGVLEEVRTAGEVGPTAAKMLGLQPIQACLAGTLSMDACKAAIALATRQYAKRQLTWFRRETAYTWVDLDQEPDALSILIRLAQE